MLCRVCKHELEGKVCSFCGEDNTPYIKNIENISPEPPELNTKQKNDSTPRKKPISRKVYRVKSTYHYRFDKRKVIRNIIILLALIALIVFAINILGSEDKESTKVKGETMFSSGMLAIASEGKWGYVNAQNSSIFAIAPQFSHVTNYGGECAAVCVGGLYTLIDKEGSMASEPMFDAIGEFSENGYVAAKQNGKWGYIDYGANYVIEPKFSAAGKFASNKMAAVSVNGSYGYIGEDGEYTIAPQYEMALAFCEGGIAPVKVNGKWGYIGEDGAIVIEPSFEEAYGFKDGIAVVKKYGDYGAITTDGKFAIAPQFDERFYFDGEYARVKIGDKFGFIDKEGKYTVNPAFKKLGGFDSLEGGLSPAMRGDGKCGYIDISGSYKISPVYEDCGNFSLGLAPVKKDGLWGYIDKEANEIVEARYIEASEFYDDGYAWVKNVDGSILIIDTEGKIAMLQEATPIDNILK